MSKLNRVGKWLKKWRMRIDLEMMILFVVFSSIGHYSQYIYGRFYNQAICRNTYMCDKIPPELWGELYFLWAMLGFYILIRAKGKYGIKKR